MARENGYRPYMFRSQPYQDWRDVTPDRKRKYDYPNEHFRSIDMKKPYNENDKPELDYHGTNTGFQERGGDKADTPYIVATTPDGFPPEFFKPEAGVPYPLSPYAPGNPSVMPIETTDKQILILNFNGEQGSTTFIEEVSAYDPASSVGCSLDTSTKKYGSASARFDYDYENYTDPSLQYLISPEADSSCTLHGWYYISKLPSDCGTDTPSVFFASVSGHSGYGYYEIYLYGDTSDAFYVRFGGKVGHTGDTFSDSMANFFAAGGWHHLAITINGRIIKLYYDGENKHTYTATYDNPLFLDKFIVGQVNSVKGTEVPVLYADAFELTNEVLWTEDFTPPALPPQLGIKTS